MGEAEAEAEGQAGIAGKLAKGQGWDGEAPLDHRTGGVREDFLEEQTPGPEPEGDCCS